MKKKVAIFDIDGTIFRSSLLIEVTDALIQEGIFPTHARRFFNKAYKRWLDREDTYEEYIGAVVKAFLKYITGVKQADFARVSRRAISFHKNRVYRYTRDLLKELRKKKYYIVAISKSPMILVQEFGNHYLFDKVYGTEYVVNKEKKFVGMRVPMDDKSKLVKDLLKTQQLTLSGSVGVGDTESDIPFLKLVQKPICFNPNLKLYKYAKRAEWRVVVERKDVIYEL